MNGSGAGSGSRPDLGASGGRPKAGSASPTILPDTAPGGAPSLQGRRLLVVEDEYFIAAEYAHTLESMGAVVVGPTATVEGALQLIAMFGTLDGAILDIDLRGEAVYPVADLLRARTLPFLFVTGHEARRIHPGYDRVPRYEKPVDLVNLQAALEGLLGRTEDATASP